MVLKTTNIKGKEYVEVNERLKAFRTEPQFMGWSLVTEIVDMTPESCTLAAKIIDKEGKVIATGLAHEDKQASMVNRTSFVENCETSAWGRALGNLGIGIDSSICSAQELLVALAGEKAEQEPNATTPKQVSAPQQKVSQNAEKPQPQPTAVGSTQPVGKIAIQTAAQLQLQKSVADYLQSHPEEVAYYQRLVGKTNGKDWMYADYIKAQNEINRIAQEKLKQGQNQNADI